MLSSSLIPVTVAPSPAMLRLVLATMVVPVIAPAVVPPIVALSIVPPFISIVVKVADPVDVKVPATVNVLPEPTLSPTEVPDPPAVKIPSTVSRSLFIFVPQVSVDAPTSGFVKFKFVVNVSAIKKFL